MKLLKKTIREALSTPGFTLLYIIGVAFTVAFTTVYGMLLYGQLGPVYPEYERSNTIYVDTSLIKYENYIGTGSLSRKFIDDFIRDSLPSVEKVTAIVKYNGGYPMVQTDGLGPEFHVQTRYVEPSFFDFYSYEIKAGKPFSQGDFESGRKVAVVSDKIARRLFGDSHEAIGKEISIDHVRYRISGVVREGSALCIDSYGEVFIPYTLPYLTLSPNGKLPDDYKGSLKAIVKVRPGMEDDFRRSLNEISARINSVDSASAKFYLPRVVSHAQQVLSNPEVSIKMDQEYKVEESPSPLTLWKPFLLGFLVVLIIPALNISGLIGARMDRMREDIGIRRCFGARRPRLMAMVMNENLILTLIGGIIGLIGSWIIVSSAGTFLSELTPHAFGDGNSFGDSAAFATDEMKFAPLLFLLTLAVCLVLNLVSAWIPAYRAMHRPITDSLNSNR